MTNDQKRTNIAAEVARGESALRSAELLLGAAQHADAGARTFVAAARAILQAEGWLSP